MGSLELNDIGFLEEVHKLVPSVEPDGDQGPQSLLNIWTCAWSQDGSLFAWSYGNRSVKIIPWSKIKAKERVCEEDDFSEKKRSGSLQCQYIELSETLREFRRQCSLATVPHYVTINCGHEVHSLAFGSGRAKTEPGSIKLKALRQVEDMILATGFSHGRLRIWDVATGGLLWELMDHRDVIGQLKFSPTGNLELASACRDGTIKLWDMKDDGNMFKTLRAAEHSQYWARACAWSPDGKYLAGVGSNKTAVIWEMEKHTVARKLEGHHHDVLDCDYSPDGALLATCSFDTRVIVWDPQTGDQIRVFCHLYPEPHPILAGGSNGAFVRSVSFSQDGIHISSVCDDGRLRIWAMDSKDVPIKQANVEHGIYCAYRPTGDILVVGTEGRSAIFYRSHMKVNSLKNLCRMAVRRNVSYKNIDALPCPKKHREFFKYRLDL